MGPFGGKARLCTLIHARFSKRIHFDINNTFPFLTVIPNLLRRDNGIGTIEYHRPTHRAAAHRQGPALQ